MKTRTMLAVTAVMAVCAFPRFANAEGALAVSIVSDVARQGFASGTSRNKTTFEEAEIDAVRNCREEKSAPAATKQLCRVILTFRDQCAAVALDPQAGTPGVGWAVAPTKSEGESIALAACERTAGIKRKGKCEVTLTGCDGSTAK